MLQYEQPFVLGAHAAQARPQVDGRGRRVGALYPVFGAARQVVPADHAALVALLAGTELLQVVRGGHAADVEEVLVLADAPGARLGALAFRRDAVDGDFRAVHRQRPGDADLRAELVHQVHVGVQAEVARVLDHPVGAGLAEVAGKLGAALEGRPVLGVGPATPEQHVAMLERVEAAALPGPARGAHGPQRVRGVALLALALGRRVVPVHRTDVIAVGAVLGGELPVAFVDIAGRAAQHLEAFRRLVDDHVDDLRRLAQVLGQRPDIGVEAAEQEATVGLEARHPGQVVRALAVEALRVAGLGRVLDLEQLAGVVEGPAVERTGIAAAIAALVPAEHRATVAAGVDEGVELAVAVARDDDRLAADLGGQVVVDSGNLAFVGEIDPVALEDVLHLQFEQAWIGEHLPLAAVDAALGVFLEQRTQVIATQGHGRGLRCYCSGPVRLGSACCWGYPLPADRWPIPARRGGRR